MSKKIDYTSSRSEPTELVHVKDKPGAKGISIEGKLRKLDNPMKSDDGFASKIQK